MSERLNHFQAAPTLSKALMEMSGAIAKSSIDKTTKILIDIRASQLNGCAFCLDMHIKQAKINGERELRIHHVAIWRESPLFTPKEKAVLALTEELTQISKLGVNEDVYRMVKEYYSENEISELTFSIAVINMWNRLQILSQMVPGSQDVAFGLTKAGLN